jgi:hypothetical protein
MSVNFKNFTPNKTPNHEINSLKSTPKFPSSITSKENMNLKLKLFNSNKNCPNSSNKTIFNSSYNSKNNSCFLVPFSKTNISKTNDYTQKKFQTSNKKILSSDIKSITHKINNENNSFTETNTKFSLVNNFLNKKRKLMTSEEIEFEKINKEKEIQKKLLKKNRKLYLKSFNYSPMKITPSPLTTFIPFKLSSNNNSKYIKQGKSNTIYEVNKQNQKIRLKMQEKIEKLADNKTKEKILLNNADYLKKQTELYNDLFNKENTINNSFININEKNINLSTNEKNRTPLKELINKDKKEFNIFKNNHSVIFNSKIKLSETNKILEHLKSIRKSNN